MHNLSEDKLMKTLELGGFPMPSIAVTKAEMGWENLNDPPKMVHRSTIDYDDNEHETIKALCEGSHVRYSRKSKSQSPQIRRVPFKSRSPAFGVLNESKKIPCRWGENFKRMYKEIGRITTRVCVYIHGKEINWQL